MLSLLQLRRACGGAGVLTRADRFRLSPTAAPTIIARITLPFPTGPGITSSNATNLDHDGIYTCSAVPHQDDNMQSIDDVLTLVGNVIMDTS
jgi:hypothetical protein